MPRYIQTVCLLLVKSKQTADFRTMFDFHNFWSHFHGTMHSLPQKLKPTLFEILSIGGCPKSTRRSEKKFQITLILVFEVIVQPPKVHFFTISSETKFMKITHSAAGGLYIYLLLALLVLHCLFVLKYFWFLEFQFMFLSHNRHLHSC